MIWNIRQWFLRTICRNFHDHNDDLHDVKARMTKYYEVRCLILGCIWVGKE